MFIQSGNLIQQQLKMLPLSIICSFSAQKKHLGGGGGVFVRSVIFTHVIYIKDVIWL